MAALRSIGATLPLGATFSIAPARAALALMIDDRAKPAAEKPRADVYDENADAKELIHVERSLVPPPKDVAKAQ
jgi:hypothetical protein